MLTLQIQGGNNISITGCDGVIVEDCLLERAGVNGVEPRMGIDIEGYGENAVNMEEPLNIQIRNNISKRWCRKLHL
ncbi:hypothetical protein ACEQPO_02750 [Bacillus sp. SL00103]